MGLTAVERRHTFDEATEAGREPFTVALARLDLLSETEGLCLVFGLGLLAIAVPHTAVEIQ